jgi:hypothetical protein
MLNTEIKKISLRDHLKVAGRQAGWQVGRLAGWQVGRLAGLQAGRQADKQRIRLTYRQNIIEHGGHAGRRGGRQVGR